MCRAAIDISLLWSERHQHTKIQGASSIVGAQPLRVQRFPHCPSGAGWGRAAIDRSSGTPTHQNSRCLHGFLAQRVQRCATIPHCAPLERGDWMCRAAIDISLLWSERHQHTKIQGASSIVGARFPRPAGWGTQRLRVQWCATIPHCAPLERGDWTCRAAIDISLLWSERHQHTKIQGASSIVGARFPRPAGWGTQPLRI